MQNGSSGIYRKAKVTRKIKMTKYDAGTLKRSGAGIAQAAAAGSFVFGDEPAGSGTYAPDPDKSGEDLSGSRYLFFHSALRFSRNADIPSNLSSEPKQTVEASTSSWQPECRFISIPSFMATFA